MAPSKVKHTASDDTSKHALYTNDKFVDLLYRLANHMSAQSDKNPGLLASFRVIW